MKKCVLMIVSCLLMGGCTSLTVSPISSNSNLKHVVIVKNPKVEVKNFISVLQEGFERHGISTEIYAGGEIPTSIGVVNYTALRSWDGWPYMSVAEVTVKQDSTQVGRGDFYLRGKGGLSLMKWRGTRYKINPLMDEMLKNYPQTATDKQ